MSDAERQVQEFLRGLVPRTCDLIDRECEVEQDRDHHVVLILLAAGYTILSGLPMPRALEATQCMMPRLTAMVHDEMLRRQAERDKTLS